MAECLTGDRDSSWNCTMCTFSNSPGAGFCAMCETKRQPSPSAPTVFSLAKKYSPADEPNTFGGPKVFDIDKALDELDGAASSIEVDSDKVQANDNSEKGKCATNTEQNTVVNGKAADNQRGKEPAVDVNGNGNGKEKVCDKFVGNHRSKEVNEGDTKSKVTENKKSPVKRKIDDKNEKEEPMELDLQWVCQKCKSLNQDYFQNCMICNTEQGSDVLAFVDDYWSDERPKTKQPDDHSRKVKKEDIVRKDDGISKKTKEWSCKRCTLKNPMTASSCAVCETPRLSNIPSADSIPDEIDYSKFTPSPTSPSCHRGIPDGIDNEKKKPVEDSGTVWKCPKCSYAKNSFKSEKCTACGEGRKPREHKAYAKANETSKVDKLPMINNHKSNNGKTSPGIYPVLNPGPSKEENASKIQRNKKISSESKEKDVRKQLFWKCPKCSFQNSNAIQSCHICGTGRKALSVPNKYKWICSKCTLLNNNDVKKCSACGNQKGEVVKKEEPLTLDTTDSEPQPGSSKFEPKPSTSRAKSPSAPPRPQISTSLKIDVDPASRCSFCTYINPYTSGPCKMCGRALNGHQLDIVVSPGTIRPKHSLKRQQSSLMKELREVEETEALELWQHITLFCKQVLVFIPNSSGL